MIKKSKFLIISILIIFLYFLINFISAEISSEYSSVIEVEVENQNQAEADILDIKGSLFATKPVPVSAEPNLQQAPNCNWKGKQDGCCSKGECGECEKKGTCPQNRENDCKKEVDDKCGKKEDIKCSNCQTNNFIVQMADKSKCCEMAKELEYQRCKLAVESTGKPLGADEKNPYGKDWGQKAVVSVNMGPNIGNGGSTSFVFDKGEVYGWRMNIQGNYERLLDSVIPHEVQHMVSAVEFRRPLPRWFDEGISSTTEHASEKNKHCQMLSQFLRTGRGISFNSMFAMAEYPKDFMPLYAQGYSVSEFLLKQGGGGCEGKRKLYDFMKEGMANGDWNSAVKKYYGFNDLRELQNDWLKDFANGGCNPCTQ